MVAPHQGDVVWIELPPPYGSEPSGTRPALVIQSDRFNESAIATVVVAVITSNMALAAAPGNVRLRAGEAGLPKASVVNVSQLRTIDRARIKRRSGQLSRERLSLVWSGIRLVLEPSTGLGTGGYSD